MAETGDILKAVVAILLIIISVTMGTILGYYGLQFRQLRTEMVMVKRHGHLVLIMIPLAMVSLFLGLPLSISTEMLPWVPEDPVTTGDYILEIFDDLLMTPLGYFMSFFAIERLWLCYYDIQFSSSQENLKWKEMITSNIRTLRDEKWFVAHRHTLGNERYLTKWIIGAATSVSVIVLTNSYLRLFGIMDLKLWTFLNPLIFLLLLILMITMSRKLPQFEDHFFLHREFTILSWCWGIVIVLYFLVGMVDMAEVVHETVTQAISYFLQIVAQAMNPFIASFYVLRKINSPNYIGDYTDMPQMQMDGSNSTQRKRRWSLKRKVSVPNTTPSIEFNNASLTVPGSSNSARPRSPSSSANYKLVDILEDIEYVDLFAQHLVKEFCAECLLSTIEFQQFKKYVMESYGFPTESVSGPKIEFPPTVPPSDIIHPEGFDDEKRNSIKLFPKLSPIISPKLTPKLSTKLSINSPNNAEVEAASNLPSMSTNNSNSNNSNSATNSNSNHNSNAHANANDNVKSSPGGQAIQVHDLSKLEEQTSLRAQMVREKVFGLYQKYISNSGEFSINISDPMRSQLGRQMEAKERLKPEDLVTIFDESTKEMMKLMGFSKARFHTKYVTSKLREPGAPRGDGRASVVSPNGRGRTNSW